MTNSKITETQANAILDTIAENICGTVGSLTDDDFIDENCEFITYLVNHFSRQTFEKVCDILGIEEVTEE